MKRILFVDDEPNILDGLRRALRPQRDRWQMAFASSGPQALEMLASESCDMIVSDMRMPGMDGAALLASVCERHPAVIRIILSGYTDLTAFMCAVPVAHQFFLKPCDPLLLREAIDHQTSVADRYGYPPVAELVGSLRALPVAPHAYQELRREVAESHPSLDHLVKVVTSDVGVSTRALQLAHSAFFGQRQDIADIRAAVARLGSDILRHLVLAADTLRSFEPATAIHGFDIDDFQRHSHLVGTIAERVGGAGLQAHVLYKAGLLHDVGKLVLADRAPDQFGQAQKIARAEGRPSHQVEEEMFGVSHAEIGAYLLGLWGLPPAIVEAVAHHHHPERASDDQRPAAAALYLADYLARLPEAPGITRGSEAPDAHIVALLGGPAMWSTWTELALNAARLGAQHA